MTWPSVFPVELAGSAVRVREIDGDDAAHAMAWAGDPSFFRYLPAEPPASLSDERRFLDTIATDARKTPRLRYELGVEERRTGHLVGMVRLGIASIEDRTGDLGYGLRSDSRGRGLATEAAWLIVHFGFTHLGLHRISATHDPSNTDSERVLVRLGMTREGVLRDHLRTVRGWRDSVLHSLLENELPANPLATP